MDNKMNIFIAYNGKSEPISVLLAKSREAADLVWMGMGIEVINVEEIDPVNDYSQDVVILLNSKLKMIHTLNSAIKVNIFKRGR